MSFRKQRSRRVCRGAEGAEGFGPPGPKPSAPSAPRQTLRDLCFLKDMTKPHHEVLALATAERAFDAKEDAVDRSEAEADAVVGLEVAQREVLGARRNLA